MSEFPFLFEPQPWRLDAACRGLDTNLFYVDRFDGHTDAQEARKVCRSCTVRTECLDDAIATFDKHGVRGGMSPNERRVEARRRRFQSRAAEMAA